MATDIPEHGVARTSHEYQTDIMRPKYRTVFHLDGKQDGEDWVKVEITEHGTVRIMTSYDLAVIPVSGNVIELKVTPI